MVRCNVGFKAASMVGLGAALFALALAAMAQAAARTQCEASDRRDKLPDGNGMAAWLRQVGTGPGVERIGGIERV